MLKFSSRSMTICVIALLTAAASAAGAASASAPTPQPLDRALTLKLGLIAQGGPEFAADITGDSDVTTILTVDAGAYASIDGLDRVDLTLPVDGAGSLALELDRFEVLTPSAVIVAMTPSGEQFLPPPNVQLWKGRVAGKPDSLAYVSLTPNSAQGLVTVDGVTYSIATVPERVRSPLAGRTVVTRTDAIARHAKLNNLLDPGSQWSCGGGLVVPGVTPQTIASRTDRGPGGCRTIRVAIDADNEFAADFGNNVTNATAYITQLMGAISAVYQREVSVTLTTPFIRVWTTTDPWTAVNTGNQLDQFRTYWMNNRPAVVHDLAHQFSARGLGGGVAYLSALCNTSIGFGVSANLNAFFPAPLADNNANNWDPYVVAHELGHNFGTGHTHDSYSPPIDNCGNGDCTAATLDQGSIMSYCHQCSGGVANINFTFTPRVVSVINGFVASVPNCGITTTGTPPTVSNIAVVGSNCPGGSVTLSVTQTGGGTAPRYTWYRNGTRLLPTVPSITLSNLSIAANATYRCDVSNGCVTGSSNSLAFSTCIGDFNCSGGQPSPQDIFDYLAAWFAGNARADINFNNGVSVQDIFDFMAAWFLGC